MVANRQRLDAYRRLVLGIVEGDVAQHQLVGEIAVDGADREVPGQPLLQRRQRQRQDPAPPPVGASGDHGREQRRQHQQRRRQRRPGDDLAEDPQRAHQKLSPIDRWKATREFGSGLGVPSVSQGVVRLMRTPTSARMVPITVL